MVRVSQAWTDESSPVLPGEAQPICYVPSASYGSPGASQQVEGSHLLRWYTGEPQVAIQNENLSQAGPGPGWGCNCRRGDSGFPLEGWYSECLALENWNKQLNGLHPQIGSVGGRKVLLGCLPASPGMQPGSHPGSVNQVAEITVHRQDSFHHVCLFHRLGGKESWRGGGGLQGVIFLIPAVQ